MHAWFSRLSRSGRHPVKVYNEIEIGKNPSNKTVKIRNSQIHLKNLFWTFVKLAFSQTFILLATWELGAQSHTFVETNHQT